MIFLRWKTGKFILLLLIILLVSCDEKISKRDFEIKFENWVSISDNAYRSFVIPNNKIEADSIKEKVLVVTIYENNIESLNLNFDDLRDSEFEIFGSSKIDKVLLTKKNVWGGVGGGANNYAQLETIQITIMLPVRLLNQGDLNDFYQVHNLRYDTLNLIKNGDVLRLLYKSKFSGKTAEASLIIE